MMASASGRLGILSVPTQYQDQKDRSGLKELLVERSLSFGEVELSSGEKSDVYIDGKLTTCHPRAMRLIGRLFLQEIAAQGWTPEAVGGLTVGADPIAFAIARESLDTDKELDAFIVRKTAKEHGKQKYVEGLLKNDSPVVIIDDVCTKGGSTGKAIEKAQEAGLKVLGAACLVDREQGAEEFLLAEYDCALARIYTLSELVAHARSPRIHLHGRSLVGV